MGIGIDQIPSDIRNSKVLSGNDLGILGNIEQLPSKEEIQAYTNAHFSTEELQKLVNDKSKEKLHHQAKELLKAGKVESA